MGIEECLETALSLVKHLRATSEENRQRAEVATAHTAAVCDVWERHYAGVWVTGDLPEAMSALCAHFRLEDAENDTISATE